MNVYTRADRITNRTLPAPNDWIGVCRSAAVAGTREAAMLTETMMTRTRRRDPAQYWGCGQGRDWG